MLKIPLVSVGNLIWSLGEKSLLPQEVRTGWDTLTLLELLFAIPISNATLERMFSKFTRVLTTFRSSLKEIRLENILRVMEEGPAWEEYDPIDTFCTQNLHPTSKEK